MSDVHQDDETRAGDATLSQGLRAVLAAADELLACPDLDTLVRRTVELPRERLGIERCSLFVRDGGLFSGTYGTDMEGHTTDEREYHTPTAEYMPAIVLVPPPEGPRWVHIPSTMHEWNGEGSYEAIAEGWVACTPFWHGTELAGVMWNDRAISGAPVDVQQQEMLAVYASLVGSVLGRRRAESKQETLMRAVLGAVDELLACPDLDALHRRAVELAREKLGVERCSLTVRDGDWMQGTYSTDLAGQTADERGYRRPFDEYWAGAPQPPSPDRPRWECEPSPLNEWDGAGFRPIGDGWIAGTHIWQSGEFVGVLWNDNAVTRGPVDPQQQDALAVYASFVGSLIARRRAESRQATLMRAVLEAAQELMQCPDTDTLHRRAVEIARSKLGVERCALFLVEDAAIRGTYGTDDKGNLVDERAVWHERSEDWEPLLRHEFTGGPAWELQSGTDLTYWNGASIEVLGTGWVARNVLATSEGPIGLFWNDAALSGAPPDRVQQWFIAVYCSVLASILQRKRAEESQERMAEGLERVVTAARELMGSEDPESLYRRGVELARERLGLERCGLFLWDGQRLRGTYGTDYEGRTTDERALSVEREGAWGRALHLRAPGEKAYDIEYLPLSYFDGEKQVVGKRAWVAMTTLATTDRVIGGFSNDAAISGTAPDEIQQQVLSVYCSVLASLIELKRAEQQVSDSQRRFQALIENSNDVIMTVDEGLLLSYVSPSVTRVAGWQTDELTGHHLSEFVHPDDRERIGEVIRRRFGGQMPGPPAEFRGRCNDGRWLEMEALSTMPDAGSPIDGMVITARDISDRKHLEQHVRQASKLEAIGTLAGGIAHDFNNLLTGVLGYAELLLSREPDARSARNLRSIQQLAERGAGLVRQLLVFSRGQSGQRVPVDLNEVIANHARLLRRVIGEDVHQVLDLAPDLHTVSADAGQVEQVLMNLAINARDAMPGGGTLTITTSNVVLGEEPDGAALHAQPGCYACVRVSDTGHGMDAATLERAFEPFFTTKPVGQGTGLGLATVYGIVRQHGGAIDVDSVPGRGTTVTFYLPMTSAPARRDDTARRELNEFSGTETILVVEDEPSVLELVCRVLDGQGYRVLPAPTPADAQAAFAQRPDDIDLLISDLVMPQMTGVELLDSLVAQRPGLRVLYMSGYADHPALRQSSQTDGRPFLPKPFGPTELAAKVREVLDARE